MVRARSVETQDPMPLRRRELAAGLVLNLSGKDVQLALFPEAAQASVQSP